MIIMLLKYVMLKSALVLIVKCAHPMCLVPVIWYLDVCQVAIVKLELKAKAYEYLMGKQIVRIVIRLY